MNRIKTSLILLPLAATMAPIGVIGGKTGMVFTFLMAGAMIILSYCFTDRNILTSPAPVKTVNRSRQH